MTRLTPKGRQDTHAILGCRLCIFLIYFFMRCKYSILGCIYFQDDLYYYFYGVLSQKPWLIIFSLSLYLSFFINSYCISHSRGAKIRFNQALGECGSLTGDDRHAPGVGRHRNIPHPKSQNIVIPKEPSSSLKLNKNHGSVLQQQKGKINRMKKSKLALFERRNKEDINVHVSVR